MCSLSRRHLLGAIDLHIIIIYHHQSSSHNHYHHHHHQKQSSSHHHHHQSSITNKTAYVYVTLANNTLKTSSLSSHDKSFKVTYNHHHPYDDYDDDNHYDHGDGAWYDDYMMHIVDDICAYLWKIHVLQIRCFSSLHKMEVRSLKK